MDADIVINDEDLSGGEEPIEMREEDPDKPMYPPLQLDPNQKV